MTMMMMIMTTLHQLALLLGIALQAYLFLDLLFSLSIFISVKTKRLDYLVTQNIIIVISYLIYVQEFWFCIP